MLLEGLVTLTNALCTLHDQGDHLMATMQEILDATAAQTTVITSVQTLVTQIVARLSELIAAGASPAQLQAELDLITANTAALSQAAATVIPGEPTVVVSPVVTSNAPPAQRAPTVRNDGSAPQAVMPAAVDEYPVMRPVVDKAPHH